MARYLIQSAVSFCFLHSDPRSGDISWSPSLATAICYGVMDDMDQVAQIIEDHCDRGTTIVVDLDRDYLDAH